MSATEQGFRAGGPCGSHQTRFVMPIADDVRLVTVDTARAVAGVTAEEIKERYEDHLRSDHLPAFDLSLERNLRGEARIWARCLRTGNQQPATSNLETIIADCLLTNVVSLDSQAFNLNASQLERAWCVSNQTILRLIAAAEVKGVRVGRNWKVNRLSAANFLRRRAL